MPLEGILGGAEEREVGEIMKEFNINSFDYTEAELANKFKSFFTKLKETGVFNGFESHHIFPIDLFNRASFRIWFEKYGYDTMKINGEGGDLSNLIMLEAFTETLGLGTHTQHNKYTQKIGEFMDERWRYYTKDKGLSEIKSVLRCNLTSYRKNEVNNGMIAGSAP